MPNTSPQYLSFCLWCQHEKVDWQKPRQSNSIQLSSLALLLHTLRPIFLPVWKPGNTHGIQTGGAPLEDVFPQSSCWQLSSNLRLLLQGGSGLWRIYGQNYTKTKTPVLGETRRTLVQANFKSPRRHPNQRNCFTPQQDFCLGRTKCCFCFKSKKNTLRIILRILFWNKNRQPILFLGKHTKRLQSKKI